MNLYSSSEPALPSVIAMPTASCYFETLHNQSSSHSIHDLIQAPDAIEPALDELTIDQIQNIEQALRKVKKRKVRQAAAQEAAATAANLMKQKHDNAEEQPVTIHRPSSRTVTGPPAVEIRDGVEWVSFVYSHNRVLQRYSVRTDIDDICLNDISVKFQNDNCVYPRANVPKETYQGNRWNYETQCNILGWKLAWVNDEIAGKRGLIQRAVDSYRNRNPNMRSRRVARQAKLLNGTLRKRKAGCPENQNDTDMNLPTMLPNIPRTMTMEDEHHERFRVKITLDQVNLDDIDPIFRMTNCVYPRSMKLDLVAFDNQHQQQKWMEEKLCNELGWKMAWLNPRLMNKRNLLQRALDLYRIKFMPSLAPRRKSSRTAPTPSTAATLISPQHTEQQQSVSDDEDGPCSPALTCTTGSTESLDFGECFSMGEGADDLTDSCDLASINTSLTESSNNDSLLGTPSSSPLNVMVNQLFFDDQQLQQQQQRQLQHQELMTHGDTSPCLFDKDLSNFFSPTSPIDINVNSNNQLMTDLPSSAVMDFTNGVFDHDLLFKMEQTADDLFSFL